MSNPIGDGEFIAKHRELIKYIAEYVTDKTFCVNWNYAVNPGGVNIHHEISFMFSGISSKFWWKVVFPNVQDCLAAVCIRIYVTENRGNTAELNATLKESAKSNFEIVAVFKDKRINN